MTGISRRRLLQLAGGSSLAVAATGAGVIGGRATADSDNAQVATATRIPFRGRHQAGIATPVQDRLHFVSFDVTTRSRRELVDLLQKWTIAAERMTQGLFADQYGAFDGPAVAPPADTGEAAGLPASRLTLTIGFGPTLFGRADADRFGLRRRRPAALNELPHFPADALDPRRSHGDIAIQACADDPQVAVHAVRNLARIGFGTVAVRWSQLGFGKTSSTTPAAQTPRNLFGFKDGTRNISGDAQPALAEHVWVQPGDGPDWLRDGSYLVARRIRMRVETWDRTPLSEQEQIIGRHKGSGAFFGRLNERDTEDERRLPSDSHVALARSEGNGGIRILRRGYSFADGSDGLGSLDAGLFFLAYQRDPRDGFIPLQRRLARDDGLNEYIQHTGSGLWACPPGVTEGQYWGQALLEG